MPYRLEGKLFKHKQTLPRNIISQHEMSIISEFSKQEDLVFTKADKGRATVTLYVEDYMEKANKELKDENYYKRISYDPRQEHMKIVNDTIQTFHRQQVLAKPSYVKDTTGFINKLENVKDTSKDSILVTLDVKAH